MGNDDLSLALLKNKNSNEELIIEGLTELNNPIKDLNESMFSVKESTETLSALFEEFIINYAKISEKREEADINLNDFINSGFFEKEGNLNDLDKKESMVQTAILNPSPNDVFTLNSAFSMGSLLLYWKLDEIHKILEEKGSTGEKKSKSKGIDVKGIGGLFKGLDGSGNALSSLGLGLITFAGAIIVMSEIDWGWKHLVGLGIAAAYVTGCIVIAKNLNENAQYMESFSKGILYLSLGLGAFAISLLLAGFVSKVIWENNLILGTVAMLTVYLGFVALAIIASNFTSEMKDFSKGVLYLSLGLTAFAFAILVAGFIGKLIVTSNLIENSLAMIGLMLSFTYLATIISSKTSDLKSFAIGTLLLVGALIAFGFASVIIGEISTPERLAKLGIFVLMFSVVIKTFSILGDDIQKTFKSLVLLGLFCLGLLAISYIWNLTVENLVKNATMENFLKIGLIILTLVGLSILVSSFSSIGPPSLAGIGMAILITIGLSLVIGAFCIIANLVNKNVEMESILKMTLILLSLVSISLIMTVLSVTLIPAIVAVGFLSIFTVLLSIPLLLYLEILKLTKNTSKEDLNKLLDVVNSIKAVSIVFMSITGSLVLSLISVGLFSSFSYILSKSMDNYLNIINTLSSTNFEGFESGLLSLNNMVTYFSNSLIPITLALASTWMFSKLIENLSDSFKPLISISNGLKGLDSLNLFIESVKSILTLSDSIENKDIKSLETFSSTITTFIKKLDEGLSGLSQKSIENIEKIDNVLTGIANASKNLQPLIQISTIAPSLFKLADGLKEISKELDIIGSKGSIISDLSEINSRGLSPEMANTNINMNGKSLYNKTSIEEQIYKVLLDMKNDGIKIKEKTGINVNNRTVRK